MTLQIGIIGGGLSGTLVALKMLHQFNNIAITIFEKVPAQVCRGIAYSSAVGFQPLNVRAHQMNLWSNKPGDFYKWIQNSSSRYFKETPASDEFIKREIFGDYLEETFKEITADLKPNQSLKVVTEEVCRIEDESGGLKLYTATSQIRVDYAVLALGNFLPGDITIKNPGFYKSSLYQGNPWNPNWTKTLKSSDDVLFLGAGLTTIDQVINLINKEHEGRIYIMSRRGFLPQPHQRYNTLELPALPVYLGISALEVLRLVRAQLKQFTGEDRDWRNVIDHVRTQVPQIWSYLSMEERKRFLRHIRPFWEIHRHRIPEMSHAIIQKNIASGKIKVLAGRLIDINEESDRANVTLHVRGRQEERVLVVDKVVNCTGPQTDFRKIDQPLIQNLKEKGWLKTDELKLGLEVNTEGQLIGENGQVIENIFAIGSLKKAVAWECTALREISLQADQLVRKLNSQFVSL